MASEEQYSLVYEFFRAYYNQLSSECLIVFDSCLYRCMSHILNNEEDAFGAIKSEIKLLSRQLSETIVNFLQSYRHSFCIKYSNTFSLPKLDVEFDSTDFMIQMIQFVKKFCSAVMDNIESDSLIEDFSSSFPVEDNKGKFHARLKTLCYMNLLSYSNMLAHYMCAQNNKTCAILPQNIIQQDNGLFKMNADTKRYSYVWEVKGKQAQGYFPPSRFGSREIIVPKRK